MDPAQLLEVLNLTEEAVSVIGVLVGAIIYLLIKDRQCTQSREKLQARIEIMEDRNAEIYKFMIETSVGGGERGS